MTTPREAKKRKLSPIPFEAQKAQSDWLLEQFDKGIGADGTQHTMGTNFPGSASYYPPRTPVAVAQRLEGALEQEVARREALRFRGSRRESTRQTWETRVSHRTDEFSIAVPRPSEELVVRDHPSLSTEVPYEIVRVYREEHEYGTRFRANYRGDSYFCVLSPAEMRSASTRQLKEMITYLLIREIHANREGT